MRKFKRITALCLSATLALGLLSGCGSETKSKDKKTSSNSKEQTAEGDAAAAFDALSEIKYGNYHYYVNEDSEEYAFEIDTRENGFAIFLNFENDYGIDGELIRYVDNTFYVNLSAEMAEYLNSELESGDVPIDIEFTEGWTKMLTTPDGFNIDAYVATFFHNTNQRLCECADECGTDGDKITITFKDDGEAITEIVAAFFEEDLKAIASTAQFDAQTVDYVDYLVTLIKDNEDIITSILSDSIGMEFSSDDVVDIVYDILENQFGVSGDDEINQMIYDQISTLSVDDIFNQLADDVRADDFASIEDPESVTFNADFSGDVFTLEGDGEVEGVSFVYTVTEDTTDIEIPENANEEVGNAAILFILVPSYSKYIEKSHESSDYSIIKACMTAAEVMATDTEYQDEIKENDRFVLNVTDNVLELTFYNSTDEVAELSSEWVTLSGFTGNTYALASTNESFQEPGSLIGTCQADGSIVWSALGAYFYNYDQLDLEEYYE